VYQNIANEDLLSSRFPDMQCILIKEYSMFI